MTLIRVAALSYRTIQIQAGPHTITAAVPDEGRVAPQAAGPLTRVSSRRATWPLRNGAARKGHVQGGAVPVLASWRSIIARS